MTYKLGRRTLGQAAGPKSEEWALEWGQGDADAQTGKAGGTNTHAQAGNVFAGRVMRIPRMRGVGRDAMYKPEGGPGVPYHTLGARALYLIAVIPQDPLDSPRLAGPDDIEGALLIHGRRCGGAGAAPRAQRLPPGKRLAPPLARSFPASFLPSFPPSCLQPASLRPGRPDVTASQLSPRYVTGPPATSASLPPPQGPILEAWRAA